MCRCVDWIAKKYDMDAVVGRRASLEELFVDVFGRRSLEIEVRKGIYLVKATSDAPAAGAEREDGNSL